MANPFSRMFGMPVLSRCPACGTPGCQGQCQRNSAYDSYVNAMATYQDAIMRQRAAGMLSPVQQEQQSKPVPLPQEEIVCATGGIVGWRSWRVPCFGDDLRSFNGELWPVRKALRATCKNGAPQDCKGAYCTCGLYAWKDRHNLTTNKSEHNSLIGEVWMWGKIIEHEKGYRAEYSYPKSFVNSGPDARRLARIYGVKLIEA